VNVRKKGREGGRNGGREEGRKQKMLKSKVTHRKGGREFGEQKLTDWCKEVSTLIPVHKGLIPRSVAVRVPYIKQVVFA
jgi:hypothetical protein